MHILLIYTSFHPSHNTFLTIIMIKYFVYTQNFGYMSFFIFIEFANFLPQSFFPFIIRVTLNCFIKGEFPNPKLDECDINSENDVNEDSPGSRNHF